MIMKRYQELKLVPGALDAIIKQQEGIVSKMIEVSIIMDNFHTHLSSFQDTVRSCC